MAHLEVSLFLAVDHLQSAVAQEFMARYCPHSKAAFLTKLGVFTSLFILAAVALFFAGKRVTDHRIIAPPYRIAACALLAFTLGTAALMLYGLSGCSGAPAEGLIWDWP